MLSCSRLRSSPAWLAVVEGHSAGPQRPLNVAELPADACRHGRVERAAVAPVRQRPPVGQRRWWQPRRMGRSAHGRDRDRGRIAPPRSPRVGRGQHVHRQRPPSALRAQRPPRSRPGRQAAHRRRRPRRPRHGCGCLPQARTFLLATSREYGSSLGGPWRAPRTHRPPLGSLIGPFSWRPSRRVAGGV